MERLIKDWLENTPLPIKNRYGLDRSVEEWVELVNASREFSYRQAYSQALEDAANAAESVDPGEHYDVSGIGNRKNGCGVVIAKTILALADQEEQEEGK